MSAALKIQRRPAKGFAMTYAIIGSGNVGTALARQFARSGMAVGIANTRGPDSLSSLAKELGNKVVPLTLQEALKADVVILAIPFRAHTVVAKACRAGPARSLSTR
jgi:predicted dinucleotide-binding enzyme